ncbi:MAG: nitroreductase family protein [Chthonomonas sp.]|nr:nitroreductase family protein [Chthonomonas sp.]
MLFSETAPEAWASRYGSHPTQSLEGLDAFLRHRSVRRFAPVSISEDTVAGLMAAAQSASTSSNLQLWSAISVQEPSRRAAMAELCADQKQVKDAAWFFAFCADHYRLSMAAQKAGVDPKGLDYAEFGIMAIIDVALAAERFACAAEAQGYGICYIGALRNQPAEVERLLELPHGTFGAFGMCLGVPADSETARIKPRLKQSQVWFRETYDADVSVDEYELRMKPTYERRGMSTSWASHSGIRADGEHMTGRDVLLDYLHKQGFFLR